MRRRRLHVHHVITKLELGGAQQNTLYCVRNHDRRRFKVSLAAGAGGFLRPEAAGIPDARVSFFRSLRREIRPFDDLRFLLEYSDFLRKQGVDIIHTHSSKAGILGRMAARRAGVPVIIHTVHGWGFHDYQLPPVRAIYVRLERMAARHTDLLFAVSRENRARGLAHAIGRPSQYRIVRSGIDIRSFRSPSRSRAAVRRELGIASSDRVVGTVGNFKPQKAPLDFVRAAAAVARRLPRAKFVMVGDGELRVAARDLARDLGLSSRVIFTGWRRDVADLLHAFDVFALSSLFEGLPRSVLQAAASGLPVVATNAGGSREAIRQGVTGYVVARRDVAGLARRISELLGNPGRAARMGRSGAALIGEEFEIRKMLRDIETYYLEQAGKKRLI